MWNHIAPKALTPIQRRWKKKNTYLRPLSLTSEGRQWFCNKHLFQYYILCRTYLGSCCYISVMICPHLPLTSLSGLQLFPASTLVMFYSSFMFPQAVASSAPATKSSMTCLLSPFFSQFCLPMGSRLLCLRRRCHWSCLAVCSRLPFSFVVAQSSAWSLLIAIPYVVVSLYPALVDRWNLLYILPEGIKVVHLSV